MRDGVMLRVNACSMDGESFLGRRCWKGVESAGNSEVDVMLYFDRGLDSAAQHGAVGKRR